jgi:hypothetical protein
MMKAASPSEMSVNIYETTKSKIPEDSNFHKRRRENLKSRLSFTRAMSQAFSSCPLTAEVRVLAPASPCGACDAQSVTRSGGVLSCSNFPCPYHSIMVLHTRISPGA